MTGILLALMQSWRRMRRGGASAAPEWQEMLLQLYVRDSVDPTAAASISSRKPEAKRSSPCTDSLRMTGVITLSRPDAANVTARSVT